MSFFTSLHWSSLLDLQVSSNTSGAIVFGAYLDGLWFHCHWNLWQLSASIAFKELYPIVIAAHVSEYASCVIIKAKPTRLPNDSALMEHQEAYCAVSFWQWLTTPGSLLPMCWVAYMASLTPFLVFSCRGSGL